MSPRRLLPRPVGCRTPTESGIAPRAARHEHAGRVRALRGGGRCPRRAEPGEPRCRSGRARPRNLGPPGRCRRRLDARRGGTLPDRPVSRRPGEFTRLAELKRAGKSDEPRRALAPIRTACPSLATGASRARAARSSPAARVRSDGPPPHHWTSVRLTGSGVVGESRLSARPEWVVAETARARNRVQ